jgi:altronate hydrolase
MNADHNLLIRLSEADNVAVARADLAPGRSLALGAASLQARDAVPAGHRLAIAAIDAGAKVLKYGQAIGVATHPIQPGEHVHVHNVAMIASAPDHDAGSAFQPLAPVRPAASFRGFVRSDGRVGTRNYLGVISSVNCSATVCRHIARAIDEQALRAFPNVDGVVAITHGSGCGMSGAGEDMELLQRTLRGYADHPNFAGVLVVGLGCEVNQLAPLVEALRAREPGLFAALTIQDEGGTRETIDAGLAALRDMLPIANRAIRTEVSASHLVVGLQRGGSDGYSGIAANPVLGAAAPG